MRVLCCCSFRCGIDYHAPTDCGTIKKWLTKCADDSETANYISAHTKDVCTNDIRSEAFLNVKFSHDLL